MTHKKTSGATSLLFLVAALSVFTVSGCTEDKTTAPGAGDYWLDHYEQAWKLYQSGEYSKMIPVLEATKDQAKLKAGANSVAYGDYLTRLARAYYFTGDSAGAAKYGIEAVGVLEGSNAGSSNKYRAYWFAGVATADLKNYSQALPYLQKAHSYIGDTDPNWNMKNGLKILFDRLESCYLANNDLPNVAKIRKERAAKVK